MKLYKESIKSRAAGRWLDIFSAIAPNLKLATEKIGKHVPDPVYGGKDGFRLFKDAPVTGAAYANKAGGALGDGFATLMYVTGRSFKETLADVTAFLGTDGSKKGVTPHVNKMQTKVWEPSPQEVVQRKSKLNNLWRQASTLDKAQSRRVEKYLRHRGILQSFSHVKAFRFHPSAYYKNEVGNLCQAPAFLQMWQAPDGTPVNIHKIFLSVRNDGKAEMDKPKLMMKPTGRMTGGAIRIGQPIDGVLSVATGVETALSVTEATNQVCWSCLNDGLLRGFIPPKGVSHITIWADNDVPDSQGRNSGVLAAEALMRRLNQERPEITVVVKIPPIQGKDWNDMLHIDRKAF